MMVPVLHRLDESPLHQVRWLTRLAVLALAIGLLAMHSLAGGDHRAHTAAPSSVSLAAHDSAADGSAAHPAAPAEPRGHAALSADCLGPCAPVGDDVATTCLAILAGLALLYALRPSRRIGAQAIRTSSATLPRTVASRSPPPSLTLLCLSRT